jgi:serine-type D-Ala-D-Ala carboxypeptidase (penicillin-binding protein 5/6)
VPFGYRHLAAALCAAACFQAAAAPATHEFRGIAAAYLVRIDGETVWADAADRRLPQASLTKLMTALLVAQDYRPDDVVTVSERASRATGSRLGLKAGDRMRAEDLLAAALIASANDACLALAEGHEGGEAAFVRRMNDRAAELGLSGTHFVNACGHDAPGHYSTAIDLMRLADEAMGVPRIASLVARIDMRLSDVDGRRNFHFHNRNALIGRYNGAIGVKSGYTAKAGRCLIALAQHGAVRVMLVMLGGRNRWWDAHAMLDRAFEHAAAAVHAR